MHDTGTNYNYMRFRKITNRHTCTFCVDSLGYENQKPLSLIKQMKISTIIWFPLEIKKDTPLPPPTKKTKKGRKKFHLD